MSALSFMKQNPYLSDSKSTISLKRSRSRDTDDAEDAEGADIRLRRRAVNATSEQPTEEP